MEVSAADVGVDDQILRLSLDHQVVDFQEFLLQFFQSCIIGSKEHSCLRVHKAAPGTVIQLDVSAACRIEIRDDFSISGYQICNKFLIIRINLSGILNIHRHYQLLEKLGRCRDGLLCYGILILQCLHKFVMLHKWMMSHRNLSGQEGIINLGCLIVKRQSFFGGAVTHTVESPHEIQVPGSAAELTVGDHMVTSFLLLLHQVGDGCVFCLL